MVPTFLPSSCALSSPLQTIWVRSSGHRVAPAVFVGNCQAYVNSNSFTHSLNSSRISSHRLATFHRWSNSSHSTVTATMLRPGVCNNIRNVSTLILAPSNSNNNSNHNSRMVHQSPLSMQPPPPPLLSWLLKPWLLAGISSMPHHLVSSCY